MLILKRCENTDFIIYTSIQFCPKLKHLEIIESFLSEECFDTLIDFGQNIQYFSLSGSTTIKYEIGKITRLKNLRHLNLSGYNFKFTSCDLIALSLNCENLENLKIDRVSITDFPFQLIHLLSIGSPHNV